MSAHQLPSLCNIKPALAFKLLKQAAAVFESFFDVFVPWRCMLCWNEIPTDTSCHYACRECWDRFQPAPQPERLLLQVQQHLSGERCTLSHITARWSARPDEQPGLFTLIYALKYRGYWRIGFELGKELGTSLQRAKYARYDAIVPVPIHPARRRERGYNQAQIIAKGIEQVLEVPVWNDLIRRTRYTQSQTTLSIDERRKNTLGAFAEDKNPQRVHGAYVLVVDDVLTTGSTLNNVATCLLDLGALSIDAATLVASSP